MPRSLKKNKSVFKSVQPQLLCTPLLLEDEYIHMNTIKQYTHTVYILPKLADLHKRNKFMKAFITRSHSCF